MQERLTILQERIKKNWRKALTEVGTSVVGSIGLVWGISFIMSLDSKDKTTWSVFVSYFDGGELSLSILSLSGVIYLLLMKHRAAKDDSTRKQEDKDGRGFGSFLVFFAPVILAAVVVGSNPGFEPANIGTQKLLFLTFLYVLVHLVWLISLLNQPVMQTPEESGQAQEDRVAKMMAEAKRG